MCASLALAGAMAAAAAVAAAALSIFPADISALDSAMPVPAAGPVRHAGLIGLNHSGGDLRRAVRLTPNARRRSLGQLRTWADGDLIRPVQATHQVVSLPVAA